MKIDRLIGILSILLQQDRITTPELAERFEVSRRTILRDIDDLCRAGIPICTTQGCGGGISIMDGYRMDRTLLTNKDLRMILAGLRSMDSVSGSRYCSRLMEKIKTGSSTCVGGESIWIDLSSWHRDTLAPKIEMLQDAIEYQRRVHFRYYAPGGETEREIEPYLLIFKWSSWYVYGYCLLRQDFRMFKLNRMDRIATGGAFEKGRPVPAPDLANEHVFPPQTHVKAIFDSGMKWRLIEEFGADSYSEQPDGSLLFEHDCSDEAGVIAWILSCRDRVTLLEPAHIREELYRITSNIANKYRKEG